MKKEYEIPNSWSSLPSPYFELNECQKAFLDELIYQKWKVKESEKIQVQDEERNLRKTQGYSWLRYHVLSNVPGTPEDEDDLTQIR